VARHCETNQSSAFAYFFFDGKNGQKGSQTVESLIRSLIRQFSTAYGGVPAVLAKLYHSCHDGGAQPSEKSLQATLFLILEAFNDVYIVLDALDECTERKDVLKWIQQTTCWRKGKLHLLATSRPEEEIAKHLRLLDPDHVYIKQDLVSRDIERYINSILYDEDSFGQWGDEIKANIKNTVLKSARGMYALFQCAKQ
jgi:ankyrin repeat domain-containing protein 50